MVCELVCLPALALLTFLADYFGLSEGILGIFFGAFLVGIAEFTSNLIKKKEIIDGKEIKKVRFPFQTAIITILYLILGAYLFGYVKMI